MKLKTWEDITKECVVQQAYDLRQEAINWIKELEKHGDETPLWEGSAARCEHSDIHCEAKPIIEWIKVFFNIKEDEIK